LTHRDYAQSVQFVTGHLQDGTLALDWPNLARTRQTVVVYMGLAAVRLLCERLVEHGRGADTPAALIEQGTRPQQRVYVGTLATLPDLVEAHEVQAPTLIVVGEVVQLHRSLQWFRPEEKFEAPAAVPPGQSSLAR